MSCLRILWSSLCFAFGSHPDLPPSLCLLFLRCFLLLTNCKEFLPCPSCVQLCSGLNSCYGRSRVRYGKSDRLKKKKTMTHDSFVVKSFLAAGKRAPIMFSLSFSVFLRIDLLLLLGYYYYYCCCCCSVAVVIKIQKIFNRKNNNYDVK